MEGENDEHIYCLKRFIAELFDERYYIRKWKPMKPKPDTQSNFLKKLIIETIIENQKLKDELVSVNCIECNALIKYDDAVYEDDDSAYMMCIDCHKSKRNN